MNKIGCKNCGSTDTTETRLFNSPHYSKVTCNDCGSFVKFMPKPGLNFKSRCKEQLSRALAQHPENNYYKSLKKFFDENGALTPKQFRSIEKF